MRSTVFISSLLNPFQAEKDLRFYYEMITYIFTWITSKTYFNFFLFQTSYSLINEAHCFYCLSCCLAWVRLISFYILNSTVGPLWIMLRKMLVEAVCFLSVLGVITLAAGITLQVKRFAFVVIVFLVNSILTPCSSFSFRFG